MKLIDFLRFSTHNNDNLKENIVVNHDFEHREILNREEVYNRIDELSSYELSSISVYPTCIFLNFWKV